MTLLRGSRTVPRRMGEFEADRSHGNRSRRSALLTCRHVQEYSPAPAIGDEVYCQRCKTWRKVMALQSDLRAKCRTCTYNRPFGRGQFAVDGAARKHGDKTGHSVDVLDGTTVQWTYTPGSSGEQLALGDEPPF